MIPALSPCGLAVDAARSAYTTYMQFYDDPTLLCLADWYFTESDGINIPSCFTSYNWDTDHAGTIGPGEVGHKPRPWRSGLPVGDAAGVLPFCGSEEQWANGLGSPPATPTVLDPFGTPVCCTAKARPFVHFDCVNCADGASSDYTLTSAGAGGGGFMQGSDGTFDLRYVGACTWEGPVMQLPNWPFGVTEGKWRMVIRPTTVVAGIAYLTAFQIVYSVPISWDCQSDLTVPTILPGPPYLPSPQVRLHPGILTGPPNNCPNLTALTSPVYYLVLLSPALPPSDFIRPLTGTYVLLQDGPCSWSGIVRFVSGPLGTGNLPVPATMAVGAGGVVTITLAPSLIGLQPPSGVYTSLPGWNGAVPVGLTVQPYFPAFVSYPVLATLNPPTLP